MNLDYVAVVGGVGGNFHTTGDSVVESADDTSELYGELWIL